MYRKWPKTWIEKKLFQDMFFVFTYTAFPKVVKNISSRFSIEVLLVFFILGFFLKKNIQKTLYPCWISHIYARNER